MKTNLKFLAIFLSASFILSACQKTNFDEKVATSNTSGDNYEKVVIPPPPPPGEISCETAFAFANDDISYCFDQYGFSNWGWSNEIYEGDDFSLTMYAGAGQCLLDNGTIVGSLSVNYSGSTATVTYQMYPYFTLDAVHLYLGTDPYPIHKNGNGTVAPGKYPYKADLDDASTYTFYIEDLDGPLYLIAHADVCGYYE